MIEDKFSPKNQIYSFALSGQTSRLFYKLRQTDCSYLVFPNNIDHYLDLLLHDQSAYILGLGSYSGVDQDQIRIETICTNQFRNDYVGGDTKTSLALNPFLTPNSQMKYGKALGNSHCNHVSWKIMSLINTAELKSQYTFLHIPKRMNPYTVAQVIDQTLLQFRQTLQVPDHL